MDGRESILPEGVPSDVVVVGAVILNGVEGELARAGGEHLRADEDGSLVPVVRVQAGPQVGFGTGLGVVEAVSAGQEEDVGEAVVSPALGRALGQEAFGKHYI